MPPGTLSILGYASLVAGLMGALLATGAGARAGLGRGGELSSVLARRAAYFAFFALCCGMLVMEVALLTRDFSVDYVARVGSHETPNYYTAISLWSSLEGSILFWAWILAGYGALFAFTRRREASAHPAPSTPAALGGGIPTSHGHAPGAPPGEAAPAAPDLRPSRTLLDATGPPAGDLAPATLGGHLPHALRTTPLVLAVIGVVQLFFFGLLAGPANPFGIVDPPPANGPGPNPLLQNHPLMGLHPPMLYFGFVGMTVPFAFAIAALVRGNVEARWLRDSRRWMVAAWAFLTMGIIGGGWWSYEVLGWGGAWAWDPVENASFLPWLTATAFLHSAMVQERRGMLKTWNLTLMIGTFLLTLFGTFLTRSGVIDSVHAFTEGAIGPLFLGFIAVVAVGSLLLVGWRSNRLHAPGQVESAASRESAFILNNLLLAGFTFTVLLGTMWPLVVEALRGDRISVGPPYFDSVASPIGLALLFLMGIGPALPWRRASREQLRAAFVRPAAVGTVAGAGAVALGMRAFLPILTIAFAAFVLTTIVEEFRKGMRARMRIAGRPAGGALADLFRRNGARYGGYVVHVGVVVIALAISVAWTWKTEREMTLRAGERLAVEDYEVEFVEAWGREEPHRYVVGATFRAFRDGREIGEERPRLNFYSATGQTIATPSVKSSLTSDLYLTLMAVEPERGEHVTVRAIVNPGIVWLWIGGMIMGVGALIAIWPRRRGRAQAAGAELLAESAAGATGAGGAGVAAGGAQAERRIA